MFDFGFEFFRSGSTTRNEVALLSLSSTYVYSAIMGNGAKAATKRERNAKNETKGPTSQLKAVC